MVQLSLSLLSSFQFLPQYKKEPTIKSQNMIEIKIKRKSWTMLNRDICKIILPLCPANS